MKPRIVIVGVAAFVVLWIAPCLRGQDSKWEGATLKTSEVSFGSLTDNGSIAEEGKFNDASKTYEVIEERDPFVKLSDGVKSGWVFKTNVNRSERSTPSAPMEPNLSKRGTTARRDSIQYTRVFYKDTAVAKLRDEVIDKYKYLKWPAIVEDTSGEWLWLGRAWVQRSQVMTLDQAFDYCREEVRRSPTSAHAWQRRAICWMEKGSFDNAIKDFDEAIRLDPNDSLAYNKRGDSKSYLKNYEGAIKDFDEAIRLDPKDASAYNNRGFAKTRLMDFEGAIKDCDEAIRLDPKNRTSYNNRGRPKLDLKDYEGAIKDFDEAIQFDPKDEQAYINRGWAKHSLKDYQGAIKDFDEAIGLAPWDAIAYTNRGWAKHNLKDYAGAIKDYDEAIRLDRMSVYPLCNKSFLLSTASDETIRDATQAARLAEQGRELDPKNAYAKNAMSCAQALAGDFENAIVWQKKAIDDAKWMTEDDIDGGVHAQDRIAKWEAKELWLQPE